jgi:hypothetical protein
MFSHQPIEFDHSSRRYNKGLYWLSGAYLTVKGLYWLSGAYLTIKCLYWLSQAYLTIKDRYWLRQAYLTILMVNTDRAAHIVKLFLSMLTELFANLSISTCLSVCTLYLCVLMKSDCQQLHFIRELSAIVWVCLFLP